MPLDLAESLAGVAAGVEAELRPALEMIGAGLGRRIGELAPALTPPGGDDGGELRGELIELSLDHEGPPDGPALVACLAAHRSYVTARGRPGAISTGGLALARLLVWVNRATLLGNAPTVRWIGPAPRLPEADPGAVTLRARCAVRGPDGVRRAEAAAILLPGRPPEDAGG